MQSCQENNLDFIPVLNPAATDDRIIRTVNLNPGLIYYGMRKGITGAKNELDPDLEKNLSHLRKFTQVPIGVGWGISSADHVRLLPYQVHTAIIGSKTLDVYNKDQSLSDVESFIRSIVQASEISI